MANVKAELEDLALRTMHADAYVDLQRRVAKRRLEREADINQVITIIEKKLAEVGSSRRSRAAEALLFHLEEDARQGREFDEIYDLTAVRVLTNSVRDCYGRARSHPFAVEPVPGRSRIIVAMPRSTCTSRCTRR